MNETTNVELDNIEKKQENKTQENPLGTEKNSKLLKQFAI